MSDSHTTPEALEERALSLDCLAGLHDPDQDRAVVGVMLNGRDALRAAAQELRDLREEVEDTLGAVGETVFQRDQAESALAAEREAVANLARTFDACRDEMRERIDALETENARLRDVVRRAASRPCEMERAAIGLSCEKLNVGPCGPCEARAVLPAEPDAGEGE